MLVKDNILLAFLVEEPRFCPSSSGSKDSEKSLGVESICSPALRKTDTFMTIHIFKALKIQFLIERPKKTLKTKELFYLTNGIA